MASDFVDEHNVFLALTDEEYEVPKRMNTRAKSMPINIFSMGRTKVIGRTTNSWHR